MVINGNDERAGVHSCISSAMKQGLAQNTRLKEEETHKKKLFVSIAR